MITIKIEYKTVDLPYNFFLSWYSISGTVSNILDIYSIYASSYSFIIYLQFSNQPTILYSFALNLFVLGDAFALVMIYK